MAALYAQARPSAPTSGANQLEALNKPLKVEEHALYRSLLQILKFSQSLDESIVFDSMLCHAHSGLGKQVIMLHFASQLPLGC